MRLGWIGVLALFCATAARAETPKRYVDLTDAERLVLTTAAKHAPNLATRIDQVSSPFLGTTYAISPLGEGAGIDTDPRVRWDKVDCLTFVETSMALALAPSSEQMLAVLDDVRYGALPPAFNRRNHFVESQWVPHNIAKGYIRSIAREVAGAEVKVISKAFGAKEWRRMKHPEGLQLADDDVPSGRYALDIVPIDVVDRVAARIPTGTLLFVVRADSPRQSTRVTHVGFVVEKDGRRFLRHASKNPYARVVDEPFWKFLARNRKYDKWPVEGFALFEVRAPGDRLSTLGVTQ